MVEPGFAWLGLAAVVSLLTLSAFFSSSEIAIFSLTPEWMETDAARTHQNTSVLERLRADPHRLLVTILVGNNVVNIAISSITTVVLVDQLPAGAAVTVATLLASVVVLVFGEIIPKSYGLGNAEEWSLVVARPLAMIEIVLYPVVTLFDAVTRRASDALGGDRHIERPYTDDA